MLILFTLFALGSCLTDVFVPLNTFNAETIYRVNKSSQVFVISSSPQEALQSLIISTDKSAQNSDAFTLSVPSTDGSIASLVPTQDGDMVIVNYNGTVPNTLNGYLYINHATANLNVFPLFENKPINYKKGTNLFFKMSSPVDQIPVAQNVYVGESEPLSGFFGLPGDAKQVQFFDSQFFTTSTVTTYDQLELPLDKFYFSSTSDKVKYQIKYAAKNSLTIGSSGLLMTTGFPNGGYEDREFDLNNQKQVNVDAYFVPRFDNSRIPSYSGNITLFTNPENLGPLVFPMLSIAQSNITSNSPINKIAIESDGPYAIQYFLRDTTATTPSPFETTTKSSSIPQIIASLMAAAILRF